MSTDATPGFLIDLPRWVLWREIPDEKTGVPRKVPFQAAGNNHQASSTNPEHWGPYAAVHAQATTRPALWNGAGIVLGPLATDEALIGLDLDRCLIDGALAQWAKSYLRLLRTYGEISPSGGGIKLFFRAKLADTAEFRRSLGLNDQELGRKRTYGTAPAGETHPPAAEIYTSARYFTITGQQWHECPDEVAIVSAATLQEIAVLFGPRPARTNGSSYNGETLDATVPDDAALEAKLRQALASRPRLHARYHGDVTGMQDTSRSSMDMSLAGMLKAAGFTYGETRVVLIAWEGGAGEERADAGDDRYFERLWRRTAAEPPAEPRDDAHLQDEGYWAGVGNQEPEPADEIPEEEPPQARRRRGRATSDDTIAWGQPIDFLTDQNAQAPELKTEHVPAVLLDFSVDTAERMGVDPTSVALACIVSCASVVSDDWRVQPKRHDYSWTESPRLWGAIVGEPSILKTPVINACTTPIDKLEAAAHERHNEAMRLYKQRLKEAKADKSGNTPDPVHPRRDRYLVEGATVEAISEILRDDEQATQRAPAIKVLSRHDEMSEFFGNLDRYKSGGRGGGDRGAYLRLYNGGPYSVDRIGRGAFRIPNWSACFLGGIQPGPIQKIAKNTVGDGLLQRFLYAVPGPQKTGVDRAPSTNVLRRYHALFPVLTALHPPRMHGGEHPQVVVLDADAHHHREDVDTMARAMALIPDTSTRLQAAYGKWPGLFARLALIFHLVEIADARASGGTAPYLTVIPEATARRAAAFMLEIALPHLLRADALMFATTQTGHARWIAGFILAQASNRITSRDVVRAYGALRAPEDKDELAAVMASLVTAYWLEPETPSNPMKPVGAWAVNPAVHVLFAEKAEHERRRREQGRADVAARVKEQQDRV